MRGCLPASALGDVLGKVVEVRLLLGLAPKRIEATKVRTGHRPTFTVPWLEPKGFGQVALVGQYSWLLGSPLARVSE